MSERPLRNRVENRNEGLDLAEAHEATVETIRAELLAKHTHKPYHNPEHTKSVAATHKVIVDRFFTACNESLQEAASGQDERTAWRQGMEAGVMAHDVVMEIDGIGPSGMVTRRRGFIPGGNEFESFTYLKRNLLEQIGELSPAASDSDIHAVHAELLNTNPLYAQYIEAAERSIAGTDPNAMEFASPIEEDYLKVKGFSDDVIRALKNSSTGGLSVMMIDSSATKSLEGLFASTADLAACADPEYFHKTGNAEFWELQYSITKQCVKFLKEPGTFLSTDAAAVLAAMEGWRKLQPGVALGQLVRLERYYTSENISALVLQRFGVLPSASEVQDFIGGVQTLFARVADTIEHSAKRYQEFTSQYTLHEAREAPLNAVEIQTFREAITCMGGGETALQSYLQEVDQSLSQTATS